MSYILEALKKADAERERGAVPDLYARPSPLAAAYEDEAPRAAKPWLWLVAGAAIALVVVLAWQFSGSGGEVPPGVTPAPPTPAAVVVTPPTAPLTRPATSTPPIAGPSITPAPPAATKEPPAKAAPRSRVEPRPPAAAASTVVAAGSGGASSAAVKATKGASAAPAPTRAPLLAELPEDFRRQVPAMTIGGSVYSPQPANRMVIINGQVFREGDPVTPGLLLEQVGPKAAVFSLRGQRFELPF